MKMRSKLLSLLAGGAIFAAGCGTSIGTATTLDGPGVGGQNYRTSHPVGDAVAATVTDKQVHAFYVDSTDGDLRHYWQDKSSGTKVDRFEVIDGNSTVGGRTTNKIDNAIAAFTFEGTVHVAYKDAVTGSLRHAWYNNGWRYEIIDGAGSKCDRPAEAAGFDCPSTTNSMGSQIVGIVWDSGDYIPHLVYRDDTTGTLRHAWFFISPAHPNNEAWKFWRFENVDTGVAAMPKSTRIGVAEANAQMHIFYIKQGGLTNASLGHAWANFMVPGWGVEYLDGPLGKAAGATSNDIAGEPSAVVTSTGIDVFYQDATRKILQNVRYTPATGWALTNDGLDGNGTCCGNGRSGNKVGRFTVAQKLNDRAVVAYYDEDRGGINWGVLDKNGVWGQQQLDGAPLTPLCDIQKLLGACSDIDGRTDAPVGNWMAAANDGDNIYLFNGRAATKGIPAATQTNLRLITIGIPKASPLGDIAGLLGPLLGLLGL